MKIYESKTLIYVGFWRRLAANFLDACCFIPLAGTSRMFYVYWFLPGALIGWLFSVNLVVRYGGTPGKRLLGIKIASRTVRPSH